MIRITVELLPKGFEEGKKVLGVATIANNLTGTTTQGNYSYTLFKKGGRTPYKIGRIVDFPRKRLLTWDLLFRVLADAVGDRNGSVSKKPAQHNQPG